MPFVGGAIFIIFTLALIVGGAAFITALNRRQWEIKYHQKGGDYLPEVLLGVISILLFIIGWLATAYASLAK